MVRGGRILPAMETPSPVLRPVPATDRIVSIDVLRGFALLGILVMNIQAFSMIAAAYFNPTAYGDLAGGNYRVWLLGHLLFDQKFMSIFSMLFGAGVLLMWQRAERSGGRSTRLHYRRMGWLILFGLLHGYLLWWGDILYMYGMSGLLVYLFRRWNPRKLLVVGLIAVAVPFVLFLLAGWSLPYWPDEIRGEMELKEWRPPPETVAEEIGNYRGGWIDQMSSRVPKALALQTGGFFLFAGWRIGGMMLIGMALFQFGVFSAARSVRFYLAMIVPAVAVGIPVIAYVALTT